MTDLEIPPARAAGGEFEAPADLDAECGVLGAMLLSREAIQDALVILKGRHFYRPAHETIYEAILAQFASGEPADPVLVSARLHREGQLDRCGGRPYISGLVQSAFTPANCEYYADIVREKAKQRELLAALTANRNEVLKGEASAQEIAGRAQLALSAAMEDGADDGMGMLGEALGVFHDDYEAQERNGGQLTGVSTGFVDLDSLTQGFQPGQLIVVAGRPAMGKSTLAVDFLRACTIRDRQHGVIFSLEMGTPELVKRIVAAEARVPLHHINAATLPPELRDRVDRRTVEMMGAPLHIDDSANLDLLTIRTKARRLKERVDLKLMVIDYLQLLSGGGGRRPESRQQEVSDISRSLKLLAKELEIPIVALSQLNRGPEQRADKKPMVSDLRESGSIEQDADMVILLHREEAYEKLSPRAGEADLHVAKHRNGPTAEITVAAQLYMSRFVDMARTQEPGQ
ncbi:replicative DNA helicase [Streptomyces sp. RKAG293]|uniref:replicative DNA helicase n=1 Tax=Streptomyces sp. RKAG293 TaxID=2893403 RepID=UPI002033F530|nr:replicative DNA helicase [Streptomyces sp. RKAG293]MCM2424263.1 replicative DNA helicase [Streptomyces sp. RKAG293]